MSQDWVQHTVKAKEALRSGAVRVRGWASNANCDAKRQSNRSWRTL